MQSNWDKCLQAILHHEGGYVNHPKDPGGETNLGVTKRELIGTGVRFKPIKTNKFKYDFGLGIMHEIEEYQIDIENSNMFRITSMSIMKLMFENFELKNITYYQPSFDSFSDFRVMNEFDISFLIILIFWLEHWATTKLEKSPNPSTETAKQFS